MPIFKNKNFVTRNRETTNLVYAVAEAAPGEEWQETTDFEGADIHSIQLPAGMRHLYTQSGVKYFGYL